MTRFMTKFPAFFIAGCFAAANLTIPCAGAVSADHQKGSVTITVYDSETGDLFTAADLEFGIVGSAPAESGAAGSIWLGGWNTEESNPYVLTDIANTSSDWNYTVQYIGQDYDGYSYQIDWDKSKWEFNFADGLDQTADIFMKKYEWAASFTADTFFVYTGTYSEECYPVLEYYYPSTDISGTNYKHRKTYYKGDVPDNLQYGDIFLTDDEVNTTKVETTLMTYELAADTKLSFVGNCSRLMEKNPLTVKSNSYDGMPLEPFFSCFTLHLTDESGEPDYYYSTDYYGVATDVSIRNAKEGDSIAFAWYKDSPILPLTNPAEEILPGDVNGDGEFSVSDVVLLQKWLSAVPDTHLVHWNAADFDADNQLNGFDLCYMKQELVRQMN